MDKENDSVTSYLLLKNLESRLRIFIQDELSNSNPQWWKQRIPQDVKQNAEERKQKDELRKNWGFKEQPLISYIDFTDYEKIIVQKNNWEEFFRDVFHDKNAISGKLNEIEPIRNTISHTRNLDPDGVKQIRFYSEEILRSIAYYLENKSKIITQKRTLEKHITHEISTSFDRTVYPPKSTVYLRIDCPHLIPDEPIVFEIFNTSGGKIYEKTIGYSEIPQFAIIPDAGIYETSFAMSGDDWKVGERYVLKCKHGDSESFDETTIDERNPIVQSDFEEYSWGRDMILTVIDPDADRDSNQAEIVGDRTDSKLVIRSSLGVLENFRLWESGDSTGIFQGIIGFIGVNKDGTKKPYELDGKIYSNTQGHDIDDGFIEVSEKDKVEIIYSNAKSVASLTVKISK